MKNLGWIGLVSLLALQSHADTKVEDLKIQCAGQWTITEVVNAKYHPEIPPHGRFPGADAFETVQAKAVVTGFQDKQCQQLTNKYKLKMDQALDVTIWPQHTESQAHAEAFAKGLVGKNMTFQVQHSFGYAMDSGYLPLFPDVASESLSLVGIGMPDASARVDLSIDVASVYGTVPVQSWNEEQKVALAQKLAWTMGNLSDLSSLKDFHELFLSLDVQSPEAKKVLFQIIWKKFNQTYGKFTQFFHFEVGGAGYFVGHPFAEKFNGLANQVATDQEKEMLIFHFPHLLVPGGFTNVTCMNLSAQGLHHVIEQWKNLYPTLTSSHASDVMWALQKIAVPQKPGWDDECIANLQKDGNLELAQEILQWLHP